MQTIIVVIFLFVVAIGAYFISYEEEQAPLNIKPLEKLHRKFLNLDMNDKHLDLKKAIKEIKDARKIYPLDNKLKMVDIELEHKRTNQSNHSTKN